MDKNIQKLLLNKINYDENEDEEVFENKREWTEWLINLGNSKSYEMLNHLENVIDFISFFFFFFLWKKKFHKKFLFLQSLWKKLCKVDAFIHYLALVLVLLLWLPNFDVEVA